MYRLETQLVCQTLVMPWLDGALRDQLRKTIIDTNVDWSKLFHFAGHQWLLPVFYESLAAANWHELLAEDVAQELEFIATQNEKRNQRITAQLIEIARFQNAADIVPLFIKGSAYLLQPAHELHRARMLSDIDMLVVQDNIDTAMAQFLKQGYYFNNRNMLHEKDKHMSGLHKSDCAARVDLHFQLLSSHKCHQVLTPEVAFANSQVVNDNGVRYALLNTEYRIIHQICHNQLQDRGFVNRRVDLRQMYDYVLHRINAAPDMQIINQHFASIEAKAMWRMYQLVAKALFPVLPDLDFEPTTKEIALRQRFLQNMYQEQNTRLRIRQSVQDISRPIRQALPERLHDRVMQFLSRF